MESLIFTCLCQAATQLRDTRLHPLKLLPVLPAAHDEGEQVLLSEGGAPGDFSERTPLPTNFLSGPRGLADGAWCAHRVMVPSLLPPRARPSQAIAGDACGLQKLSAQTGWLTWHLAGPGTRSHCPLRRNVQN